MLAVNSLKKWIKLALVVHILHNMQNLVFSHCLAKDVCYKHFILLHMDKRFVLWHFFCHCCYCQGLRKLPSN